jgi:hypothetical protein
VWERCFWGGRGCFGVKAVRLATFHGTFGCRLSVPVVGLMMGGREGGGWAGGRGGWLVELGGEGWVGLGWVKLGSGWVRLG